MSRYKFKSNKKNKINLIAEYNEFISKDIMEGIHTEIFSNKNIIIENCKGIVDYQENYIKLKIKKGFLVLSGTEFVISSFEDEKIMIKGNIISIEFCV